jgi:hypothetical protein
MEMAYMRANILYYQTAREICWPKNFVLHPWKQSFIEKDRTAAYYVRGMDKALQTPPKAFISYSWSNREHQDGILEWAKRLTADGVDVILDRWSLKTGHDKYAFMEKMVTDPAVTKVLIFSDAEYAKKADARHGGVGTESQIISKEVYEKVEQEKFIPIVCEFNDAGPCLPVFLKSRTWIDFSTPEKAYENYDQLLRVIFDRPLNQKPPIGNAPKHLFEPSVSIPSTRPSLTAFKTAVLNDRGNWHGLATRFLDDFLDRMGQFLIWPMPDGAFDEAILTSVEQFTPFRNDFVEFVTLVCSMKDEVSLYEEIADLFERSFRFHYPPSYETPWNNSVFDNMRFILYELFLYTLALLVKYKRFNRASIFLEKTYFLPENCHTRGSTNYVTFAAICAYCESLIDRNQRLRLNRMDPLADLLKSRATQKEIPFDQIKQVDCLCFLKSLIYSPHLRPWFPHTIVFTLHRSSLDLFLRAASVREFPKLAAFLNVASKDELLTKYRTGVARQRVNQWSLGLVGGVDFERLFNFEELNTV